MSHFEAPSNDTVLESEENPTQSDSERFKGNDRLLNLANRLFTDLHPVLVLYYPDYASRYGNFSKDEVLGILCEYASRMILDNLTPKDLERGIERVKFEVEELKFTPNPTKFVNLCKPTLKELGIPDYFQCFDEIKQSRGRYRNTEYNFSHSVSRYLDQRIGSKIYAIKETQFEQRLHEEHPKAVELFLAGGIKETKHELLGLPDPKALTPERIQELRNSKDPLLQRIEKLRQQHIQNQEAKR